jgi:hypothetical protein
MIPAANPPSDFDKAFDQALSGIEAASDRLFSKKKSKPQAEPSPAPSAPRTTSRLPKKTRMEFQALHEEQLKSSDELRRECEAEEVKPVEKVNGHHEKKPESKSKSWIGRLFAG